MTSARLPPNGILQPSCWGGHGRGFEPFGLLLPFVTLALLFRMWRSATGAHGQARFCLGPGLLPTGVSWVISLNQFGGMAPPWRGSHGAVLRRAAFPTQRDGR
jgi:hypothetical protein